MIHRTIRISESTYQVLLTQSARLQLSPEYVVERLVLSDLVFLMLEEGVHADLAGFDTDTANAVAAVERLTTTFADIHLSNLETHLDDPMLALANVDLELFRQ